MDERDQRIMMLMTIVKKMTIEEIEVVEKILKDAKMVREGLKV